MLRDNGCCRIVLKCTTCRVAVLGEQLQYLQVNLVQSDAVLCLLGRQDHSRLRTPAIPPTWSILWVLTRLLSNATSPRHTHLKRALMHHSPSLMPSGCYNPSSPAAWTPPHCRAGSLGSRDVHDGRGVRLIPWLFTEPSRCSSATSMVDSTSSHRLDRPVCCIAQLAGPVARCKASLGTVFTASGAQLALSDANAESSAYRPAAASSFRFLETISFIRYRIRGRGQAVLRREVVHFLQVGCHPNGTAEAEARVSMYSQQSYTSTSFVAWYRASPHICIRSTRVDYTAFILTGLATLSPTHSPSRLQPAPQHSITPHAPLGDAINTTTTPDAKPTRPRRRLAQREGCPQPCTGDEGKHETHSRRAQSAQAQRHGDGG